MSTAEKRSSVADAGKSAEMGKSTDAKKKMSVSEKAEAPASENAETGKSSEAKEDAGATTGGDYLKMHGVNAVLQEMIADIVADKPEDPLKALEEALKKKVETRDAKNTNSALIFIKPHGQVAAMKGFVEAALAAKNIIVTGAGDVDGKAIEEKGTIDKHYAAIATYAKETAPADLPLSDDSKADFQKKFDVEWSKANEDGKVYNLKGVAAKLDCSLEAVNEKVEAAKAADLSAKLAPGCYIAHLKDDDVFVVNGFYGRMSAEFTGEKAQVSWYSVAWDEANLSWADFRANVLGATDPTKADKDSLRGKLFADHEKHGLSFTPDTGKNCVHGSASPLEGLNERIIWTAADVEADAFGKALIAGGLSADEVKKAVANPTIDGKPLFDQVEDKSAADCIKAIVDLKDKLA